MWMWVWMMLFVECTYLDPLGVIFLTTMATMLIIEKIGEDSDLALRHRLPSAFCPGDLSVSMSLWSYSRSRTVRIYNCLCTNVNQKSETKPQPSASRAHKFWLSQARRGIQVPHLMVQ